MMIPDSWLERQVEHPNIEDSSKDWVGLWYEIAKERGVNDIAAFYKLDLLTQEKTHFEFSHAKMDGVGAFVKLLGEEGFLIPQLPSIKKLDPPKLKQWVGMFRRIFRDTGQSQVPWKSYRTSEHRKIGIPQFDYFDEGQTKLILNRCSNQNVSLSAFLLSKANSILMHTLLRKNSVVRWLFPVNMRGPVRKSDPFSNHSSAIILRLTQHLTAQELNSQIWTLLKAGAHWNTWALLHIGKIVGLRGMRYISRVQEKRSRYMGTFTFLGKWPPKSTTLLKSKAHSDEQWFGVLPGTPNFPIGLVGLIWKDRLGLTLKIHPTIAPDKDQAKCLLLRIMQALASP